MSLVEWRKSDWLKAHKTDRHEVLRLMKVAARELSDCHVPGLSIEGRFNHAYKSCLMVATVLLYVSGYAPAKGQSHHYRTISAIPEILGDAARDYALFLNDCRKKRNISEYEDADDVTEAEALKLIQIADEFFEKVQIWLGKYQELIS